MQLPPRFDEANQISYCSVGRRRDSSVAPLHLVFHLLRELFDLLSLLDNVE